MKNFRLAHSAISLLKLSVPIVLGQVGQMLIGATDVLVAGKYSTTAIAAIGMANGIAVPIFMIGIGLFMAISPILSKKIGKGEEVNKYYSSTILLALLTSLLTMGLSFLSVIIVDQLNFEPEVSSIVKDYIYLISFSFPGAYLFHAVKEYLQSKEHVLMANAIVLAAVVLNYFLNHALVFGEMGFPAYGERGLAYASIWVRLFMGLSLFIYAIREFRPGPVSKKFMVDTIKIGLPISISVFVEVAAFSISSVIVGKISVLQAAAHNIILTMGGLSFMIPLAISSALSVKVGNKFGQRDYQGILDYTYSGLLITVSYMTMSALIYFIFPTFFASRFSTDQEVIAICIPIFLILGLFQLSDGIQVGLAGILRGLGITKLITYIAVFGYWVIGIPLGSYLAFANGQGSMGLWIGLAIALTIVAILSSFVLKKKLADLKQELNP